MSYQQKYLKYKEKYLELKNIQNIQKGGAKTFYIYTTGFADNGSNSVANEWVRAFREKILSLIPAKYDEIVILHSDPLMDIDGDLRMRTIKEANELLMSDFLNDRVKQSEFTTEPINFRSLHRKHLSRDYIVIDCAHIFLYIDRKIVKNANTYDGVVNEQIGVSPFPLNCIYPGFIANRDINGEIYVPNNILSTCDLFIVNEDGSIITYIDKLIMNKIGNDPNNPHIFVDNIYRKIRKPIIDKWRAIHKSVSSDFDEQCKRYFPLLYKYIFDLAMSDVNEENIIRTVLEWLDTNNFY
jgi:hypothetical protein